MALRSARDLKQDVLFRASEPSTGTSQWDTKVMDYLNRAYNTLASGASEFLPEYIEDWWWLRSKGSMLLDPMYSQGTVTLTSGQQFATMSNPLPVMLPREWMLRVEGHSNVFEVNLYSTPIMELDQPWTGATGEYNFRLMHVTYTLAEADIATIIGPLIGYQGPAQINGVSPERMDFLYPLSRLSPGPPQCFSLENEAAPASGGTGRTVIRFSHGGLMNGTQMKVDYRYKPRIVPLTDSETSYPLIPEQWRHILADMALAFIMLDKNDDRSNAVALLARTGLSGMLKENRRRLAKMDQDVGHVFPRSNQVTGRKQTEGGLVLR